MKKKLPKNWIETSLDEIAEWGSGGTPSRGEPKYYEGKIPWIKTGELNDNIIYDTEEHISEEALKHSSAKLFPKGSIAIAMYGATIGRTAVLGVEAATNQACAIANAFNGVNSNYLYYYLKSEKQNFIDKGKGGAQPNISQTVIKSHPFPLSPLNEQTRIAKKLDEFFVHLNIIKNKIDSIPPHIKQFKDSVLNQALTGKLTEKWRKKNGIDANWENTTVKEISSAIQYGYTESSTYDIIGPKFLRITDIQNNKVEWSTVPYCKISSKEKDKYLIKINDIVFARTGATVGKSFLVEEDVPEAVFASYLIRVRLKENYLPKYVWYYFNSPRYWSLISQNAKGIGQPNVNGTVLGSLEIPVPSLKEQIEIIRIINQLFAIADDIEKKYIQIEKEINTLPQSTLYKAFKGQLTPQDQNDEPAIKLLEKIRNERKSKTKQKK